MPVEMLNYQELGARLGASAEAARAVTKRLRLPRHRGNDGKTLVAVDLAEIWHKPMPARSPAGHRPDTDGYATYLEAKITELEDHIAQLEIAASGHRADFDRERERGDSLMTEIFEIYGGRHVSSRGGSATGGRSGCVAVASVVATSRGVADATPSPTALRSKGPGAFARITEKSTSPCSGCHGTGNRLVPATKISTARADYQTFRRGEQNCNFSFDRLAAGRPARPLERRLSPAHSPPSIHNYRGEYSASLPYPSATLSAPSGAQQSCWHNGEPLGGTLWNLLQDTVTAHFFGALGGDSNPRPPNIRSLVLYPAELRAPIAGAARAQ